MDLTELRNQIDDIDEQILDLFVKRMDVCRKVADYKRENNLPIMQGGREEQVIKRIRSLSPDGLEDGSEMLFTEIMDISKSIQNRELFYKSAQIMQPKLFLPKMARYIACPGVEGSNTEI
ncbi:MAG: chorismate mutase, partial [Oscillospiraceae bacterium]